MEKLAETGDVIDVIPQVPPETAETITQIASGGADILAAIAAAGGGTAGLLAGGWALFKLVMAILAKKKAKVVAKAEEKTALIEEAMKRLKSSKA